MSAIPLSYTIFRPNATLTHGAILQCEEIGVPDVWTPTYPLAFDPLTIFPLAAAQTKNIRLGAGIIPTYPRHPAVLASQALAMEELFPRRLRLGVGSSHPFIIEGMYGMSFARPLGHLREYVTVLRTLMWEGEVHFEGEYFRVHGPLFDGVQPAQIPIPIAALQKGMFRLAGEVSDGALAAWCPIPYLLETALPAMRAGAEKAERPVPPLIANVPVILETDFDKVRQAAHAALEMYLTNAPPYLKMFAAAGFPIGEDRVPSDALIKELFVYGDANDIAAGLRAAHESGIDEVMVTVHPVADPVGEEIQVLQILAELAHDDSE